VVVREVLQRASHGALAVGKLADRLQLWCSNAAAFSRMSSGPRTVTANQGVQAAHRTPVLRRVSAPVASVCHTRGSRSATKVGYFEVKSTNVVQDQMCTKPAKVGHLAATLLKYAGSAQRRPPPPPPCPPRSSLRGRKTKVAKAGPLRARVKSAKVRPTPYVSDPRVVCQPC
jgi:hypothetical protein